MLRLAICVLLVPAFLSVARADVPATNKAAMQSVTDAENAFAADLYAKLATTPGNLFFSPYSIHSALAMARDGAKGATADQMSSVLHLSGDPAETDAAFAGVIDALNHGGTAGQDRELYKLVVANALWVQSGYPIHPDYAQRVGTFFHGEVSDVDFGKQLEQARQTINAWVAGKTAGKIKELLAPHSLVPATRFVLTNAIYFKSAWQTKFAKSETADAPFHLSDQQTVNAPTMHNHIACDYYEDEQMQAVGLPYVGHGLSMMAILPRNNNGLASLEKLLTADRLKTIASQMRRAEVTIALPRFKLSTTVELSKQLASMGMQDAFSTNKADFSGISTAERLSIGVVMHQATVDVDEDGTEAAAATAVGMRASAMIRLDEKTFSADHPFVFVIRQQRLGNILFMGRMADPR